MDRYKLDNNLQEGYRQLFSRQQFDIMVTLRFEYESSRFRNVCPQLNEFTRKLTKSRRDQVAGYFIYNTLKHPHAHLLLFAKKSSLADLTSVEAESLWTRGSAYVSEAVDGGAPFYAALNITPNAQDCYEVFFYNKRLLKKNRS